MKYLSLLVITAVVLSGCANAQTTTVTNTAVDASNSQEEASGSHSIAANDWLTYEDNWYGFSLQYPSDWSVQKAGAKSIYISVEQMSSLPSVNKPAPNSGASPQLYSENMIERSSLEVGGASSYGGELFMAGNTDFYFYTAVGENRSQFKEYVTYFNYNKITIRYLHEGQDYGDELKNIVSTFKIGEFDIEELESMSQSFSFSCTRYINHEQTKAVFGLHRFFDGNILDQFFVGTEFQEYAKNGSLMDVCYRPDDTIVFVFYGQFENANNLVGIYREGKYLSTAHMVPNAGDISVCNIGGMVEDTLLYSCGGGDGGGGWNKIYTLDFISKEDHLIKDCEFYLETNTCANNLLNITEHPQARYFIE